MSTKAAVTFEKNSQYYKFCTYGFLKNLRLFDAFLLLFFLESGLSYSQIGILYASREITINLAEIPSGIIADTYGRKNSLIAAFLAYIISFTFFYYSLNFNLLLAAMLLYGIGDAFRSGTHKGMIMDYLKSKHWERDKIDYYGHTRSWSQKGSAISALLAGLMVLYSGSYRLIFIFSAVPYLFNLMNVFSYPDHLNFSQSNTKKQHANSPSAVFKNFFAIVKNRKVFQIMNSTAIHSSFLSSIKDYIQPLMLQVAVLIPIMQHTDLKKKSGVVIGIIYFLIFLLNSYASKSSGKISRLKVKNISKSTLLMGLASGTICGILITYKLWMLSLIVFVFIYMIENTRKPILTGKLSNHVPNEILTSVISALSFYKTLLTSALAIILGVIADHFGLGISLLSISALLILIAMVIGSPDKNYSFEK